MRKVNKAAKKVLDTIVERMENGNLKLDNGTAMALVAEVIGECKAGKFVSVAHYGEQNGDLMRDPDIVLLHSSIDGNYYPMSYRNDYMGINQEAMMFGDDGEPNRVCLKMQKDIAVFVGTWMVNVKHQQGI